MTTGIPGPFYAAGDTASLRTRAGDADPAARQRQAQLEQQSALAWQRAMERAQMAMWFRGSCAPRTTMDHAPASGTRPPMAAPSAAPLDQDVARPQLLPGAAKVELSGSGVSSPPLKNSMDPRRLASEELPCVGHAPAAPAPVGIPHPLPSQGASEAMQAGQNLPEARPLATQEPQALTGIPPGGMSATTAAVGDSARLTQRLARISGLPLVALQSPVSVGAFTPGSLMDPGAITELPRMQAVSMPARWRAPAQADGPLTVPGASASAANTGIAANRVASVAADSTIRLHAQWDGSAVTVWVGMDGDQASVEQRMRLLLGHLQHCLDLQGHRLSRLVCNGHSVFQTPSTEGVAESTGASAAPADGVSLKTLSQSYAVSDFSGYFTHFKETS